MGGGEWAKHSVCRFPGQQADPFAPREETLLPFPRSENIIERARGQEGRRGVGGWVRTSCEGRQTQTVLNKHTTSCKASALGVLGKEVLGIKVLCTPGPAVQCTSKGEARVPHHRPCPSIDLDHVLPGDRCSTQFYALCKARGGILFIFNDTIEGPRAENHYLLASGGWGHPKDHTITNLRKTGVPL